MANILIHPNSGIIEFSTGTAGGGQFNPNFTGGALAARMIYDNYGGLNFTSYVSNPTGLERFSIDGADGRLFSVTDNLSGSIFSVNDIAGLPIIEAFDDNTVIMGAFNRNDFLITGNSVGIGALPNTGTQKLFVSGNFAVSGSSVFSIRPNVNGTGVVLSGEAATPQNLATTGSTLDTKINSLSGYSNSNFATIANLALTGATLTTSINSLSGTVTGTYATIANLASTGSTLAINLAATGSANLTRINSLSGTLTNDYYLKSNPSGFITSENVVYTTGNQTISGSKTFAASSYVFSGANVIFTNNTGIVSGEWRFVNRPTVNGTGVVLSGEAATPQNLATTGSTLVISINSLSGTLTGNYATITNLATTGSTLATNLASTGSTLNTKIDNLSGYVNSTSSNIVFTTGNQTVSGNKIFGINNISISSESNAAILGGSDNAITGTVDDSFIANGRSNLISGAASDSFILNGLSNKIFNLIGTAGRPFYSYISNGFSNLISGGALSHSFISAGNQNKIEFASYSYIANGQSNSITGINGGLLSTILGGTSNSIQDGNNASILNGASNSIGGRPSGTDCSQGCYSSIINGSNNRIIGAFNIIGGGSFNQITGGVIFDTCCQTSSRSNVIVGGANNSILNSTCSAILGGRYNQVIHNGATVIGDGSLNVKTSRGACSLLLSFANGIFLESPTVNYNDGAINLSGSSLNFYVKIETGATVTVTQANNAVTQTVDIVSDEVELTRGSYNVLYNPLYDVEGVGNPTNTEWNADGWADLSNLSSRSYTSLIGIAGGGNFGNYIIGTELIMHDLSYDTYYKVLFSAWQAGQGGSAGYRGFSYTRTQVTISNAEINGSGVRGNLDFYNRPSVSGIGVLLIGEAGQVPDTVVQTSGTQTISGSKTFTASTSFNNNIQVTNTGTFSNLEVSANEMNISGLDLSIYSGNLVLSSPTGIPATTGASGIKGSFVWNTGHLYVCTNTNSWRRVALTTW